jgi:2,4-dienoyl-CoA reductase-like NADH-dependent reductase (Old Yellow Enzyme family)
MAMTNKSAEERMLLQPFMLGDLKLPNRVVMAPLTRMRASHPFGVPNTLMRDYYVQRASAGLIITEGTLAAFATSGSPLREKLCLKQQVYMEIDHGS